MIGRTGSFHAALLFLAEAIDEDRYLYMHTM
jgi:hypothetical protein